MHIPSSARLKQAGFTLVEVAIVVLVGGLLLALFSNSLITMLKETKARTTQTRLQEVTNALREYASYNNKLPCAANRLIAPTTAGYGVAPTTAECKGAFTGTDRVASNVRIGMVPTRTLNLPDEYGYDAWGSRFIYAVTESLTDPASYKIEEGKISVVDAAGDSVIQPKDTGTFIVLSVGPDRKGGYPIGATAALPPIPCTPGTGLDVENCNNSDTIFRSALMTSDATGGNFFDDYVSIGSLDAQTSAIPAGAVMPFNLSVCPKGWRELPEAKGHFIIGAGTSLSATDGAPDDAVPGYTEDTFAAGTASGFSTRKDSSPLSGTLGEYRNLPPYVAYLYCLKN